MPTELPCRVTVKHVVGEKTTASAGQLEGGRQYMEHVGGSKNTVLTNTPRALSYNSI